MQSNFRSLKQFGLKVLVRLSHGWDDARGQDLIEYALMAGFVVVAAGALSPSIATSISQIFSKVTSVMTDSASQGS